MYYSIIEAIRVILMPENYTKEERKEAREYLMVVVGRYDN